MKKLLRDNGLSIVMLTLFVLFLGHGLAGFAEMNQDNIERGRARVSFGEYLADPRFWFESFQNWQSEFLAVGTIVVLSIWLREKGSPESKPVASPHQETGG